MWPFIAAGFSLGLIGSFHCIGMCGPLALSLPLQNRSAWPKAFAILLYQAGRILTYTALGGIAGMAGRTFFLAGLQQGLSIVLGLLLLLFIILNRTAARPWQPAFLGKYYRSLQGWIYRLWKTPSHGGFLLMGMANGLLPCGMVWLAMAGALSTGQVKASLLFMALFGAGTIPVMFGISWFAAFISLPVRNRIRQGLPFVMAFMAVLLILRGLNLGIPFISPVSASSPGHPVSCH